MNPQAVAAPRRFGSLTGLPDPALPNDTLARIAARRAFVQLKSGFMQAMAGFGDERGHWLREQVRRAETPQDLLMLRGHVFASLAGAGPEQQSQRRALRRSLDSTFPDSAPRSGFMSF